MNRKVGLSVAIFFAVLGIGILGGGQDASAHRRGGCFGLHRHRCHGYVVCAGACAGACAGDCHAVVADCHACAGCYGRRCHGGLFARLRARRCAGACAGVVYDCCHPCPPVCHGAVPGCAGEAEEGAPSEAPAPPEGEEAAPDVPEPPAAEGEAAAAKELPRIVYRGLSFRR